MFEHLKFDVRCYIVYYILYYYILYYYILYITIIILLLYLIYYTLLLPFLISLSFQSSPLPNTLFLFYLSPIPLSSQIPSQYSSFSSLLFSPFPPSQSSLLILPSPHILFSRSLLILSSSSDLSFLPFLSLSIPIISFPEYLSAFGYPYLCSISIGQYDPACFIGVDG